MLLRRLDHATPRLPAQGLSDNFEGHVWTFDQFKTPNVDIALRSLRRMPIADRGNLPLVTRHLTYAVGADICYGKWGEGSYRTGRPSGGYSCAASSKWCARAPPAAPPAHPPRTTLRPLTALRSPRLALPCLTSP